MKFPVKVTYHIPEKCWLEDDMFCEKMIRAISGRLKFLLNCRVVKLKEMSGVGMN